MGHACGGDSPQYAQALRTMDSVLGKQVVRDPGVLGAVADWEAEPANHGEQWDVLVVTDHGHIGPDQFGRGHGFQSPLETQKFLMWDQAYNDANDGFINNAWQIVSTTPTIMNQFGIAPFDYMQGAP
jgi:predicted AlkP superfamily pyrophosphatase or phosphodiesterase